MQPTLSHSWTLSADQAFSLQNEWAKKVVMADRGLDHVRWVAGVDVAYAVERDQLFAAVVVLDAHSLEPVETSTVQESARFPYLPGLFSFREMPPLMQALEKLSHAPDLIICDGQGIAHPRRFGLASHLGVMFDVPAIGCAKTRLVGESSFNPDIRGQHAPLFDHGEEVGSVLCTQDNVKPLYVSIGHRISLESARRWVLRLSPRHRLPETTRLADQTVNQLRRLAGLHVGES